MGAPPSSTYGATMASRYPCRLFLRTLLILVRVRVRVGVRVRVRIG